MKKNLGPDLEGVLSESEESGEEKKKKTRGCGKSLLYVTGLVILCIVTGAIWSSLLESGILPTLESQPTRTRNPPSTATPTLTPAQILTVGEIEDRAARNERAFENEVKGKRLGVQGRIISIEDAPLGNGVLIILDPDDVYSLFTVRCAVPAESREQAHSLLIGDTITVYGVGGTVRLKLTFTVRECRLAY